MNLSNLVQSLAVIFIILSSLLNTYSVCSAEETVCARVKIQINQELTLERQAFDAHMRINNGLTNVSLEDIDVEVRFSDEEGDAVLASSDPNNTNALFFIRLDSMDNIDNVTGNGSVTPSTAADIHWLIIPAPGASNGLEKGKLYYVGAKLTYTIGGEEHVTEVTPDYIFVKPLPEMTLDYFLPSDVYGDDAFTSEIEPPIPFSLGVRVANNGQGVARNMKINSAQPKITENEQGLLIGFNIEGCEVNGQIYSNTLLVDFKDISPNESSNARWIMTCSLSGKFVEFKADYSHSDELGGELTSLLEEVNTHFLVHDVLVDVAGRDYIRDFLAKDGGVYRVYESDSGVTEVLNQSASSSMQLETQDGTELHHRLSTPVTAGFMFVQQSDPYAGGKVLKAAYRSDGKTIKEENAWLSKTRDGNQQWHYFVNLFDANTTNSYLFIFDDMSSAPQAPVLQFIPDRRGSEGQQLSFIVEASDPNGTIPSLSASPLAAGVSFMDQNNGTAIFDWTPDLGQAGEYRINFSASDGVLSASQRALIKICTATDSDCDQMDDAWELQHFGTLDRDGYGDYDGDGVLDRDEFLNGTDPKQSNAPSTPEIFSPEGKAEVIVLQPLLTINNSTDPDNDEITYEFQVFSNEQNPDQSVVDAESGVVEDLNQTSWMVTTILNDNSWYFWRVKATDGKGTSQWAYGSFFVNTLNDAPGPFAISSPVDGVQVDTVTPTLEVTNSTDVDEDAVAYAFMVATDSSMNNIIGSASGIPAGDGGTTSWTVSPSLVDNSWVYWKVIATDEHGASTETSVASFFVNTFNNASEPPDIFAPAIDAEVSSTDVELIVYNTTDVDLDSLQYFFEIDTVETYDSGAQRISGAVAEDADGKTGWLATGLQDETLYYWRVKASDGSAESTWTGGRFFVNLSNNSPTVPTLKNPADNAWVVTTAPKLEVNDSTDSDNDTIRYQFEVYNVELNELVASGESETPEWVVSPALEDNRWYQWKARAVDEHDAASNWMTEARFFTDSNGINDVPVISVSSPAADILTNSNSIQITWQDGDPDSSAEISLYYDTDAVGADGTLIVSGLSEDPDGNDDIYLWDISALADGTYYVYAVISDGESTDTSYASGAVTIDRTAPIVTVNPAGSTFNTAQTITLTCNETADIYYTLNGSEPDQTSSSYTNPIEISETTTLKCLAVDQAGNQSPTLMETYTITIAENLSPVADANGPYSGSVGVPVTFDASGSYDPDGEIVLYEWDWENDGVFDESSSSPITSHTWGTEFYGNVSLRATDNEGAPAEATASVEILADQIGHLEIENFVLLSKKRVSRVEYDYTYQADVVNNGPYAQNVTASVISNSPYTTVIDDTLTFADVPSGVTVTSNDTFTIRQDRRYPFDWSDLEWETQAEIP